MLQTLTLGSGKLNPTTWFVASSNTVSSTWSSLSPGAHGLQFVPSLPVARSWSFHNSFQPYAALFPLAPLFSDSEQSLLTVMSACAAGRTLSMAETAPAKGTEDTRPLLGRSRQEGWTPWSLC